MIRSVDKAIAAENRRFLADARAVREAREDGDRMRRRMVMDGMTFLAMPGDPLPKRPKWVELALAGKLPARVEQRTFPRA